jgi:putative ABC transport system permease protein
MSAVAENISRLWPDTNRDWGVTIAPLREAVVGGELRVTAWVLAGVMACVLLLACANIANLLLARGIDRTREMAVRAALGGSTTRIVRQLVTESVVLAGLGGLAGLGITWAALRAVPTVVPSGTLPLSIFLVLDGRVAAFCLTLMLATGVVCGLAPAWHAARVSWPNAAGASVRGSLQGTAAFRTMLAVVEIACAVVLLAGAGLLLRTLLSISQADAGYHADRVLTMRLTVPINRYPTQERLLTFYEALEREIAAVPGVRAVGLGGNLPLDGRDMSQGFEIYGQARPDRANRPTASYQIVSRGYFETLGIRVIRGRGFTDADTMTGKPVCVVNEEFARRYLAGRDPVGAVVNVAPITPTPPKEVAREVVGVIAQVKERADESEGAVQIYVPMTQNPWYSASIAVGSVADPAALSLTIAAAVSRVDEDQPVTQIRTMREVAAEATSRPRFRAELLAMSALFALVLAATGIFSLLAFSVQQRTREFGIRMAIGARAIDVVRLVLASGMRSTAAGCGIGLLAASTLTRFLQSLLHGVTPLDPLTFLSIPAIICLTALAACAGPALSAARAHPAEALRQEY